MRDLISRQAAIEETWKEPSYTDPINVLTEVRDRIKALPSAQPERTGRWIHDGYAFNGGVDWMHCSECGHKDNWDVATRTPFCAWCGAKMEGEQE